MILYSSSTNDSDDDSGEEDAVWSSYRKQMKSQNLISSTDSQESFGIAQDVTSSNQNLSVDTEPLDDIQSWAQMLQNVTSSAQNVALSEVTSVVVSSSSELDDMTTGDVLPNSRLLGKPPTVSKVGKKAKVRKHTKKKKQTQANQDERKGETSKGKQKDKGIMKEQDSEPCEVKSEDDSTTGTIPNDKATLTHQNEDIDKIKLRLEAQISARKGFGVLPSQEVVYDKVCSNIYCN